MYLLIILLFIPMFYWLGYQQALLDKDKKLIEIMKRLNASFENEDYLTLTFEQREKYLHDVGIKFDILLELFNYNKSTKESYLKDRWLKGINVKGLFKKGDGK